MASSLSIYRKKRDFKKTKEPVGKKRNSTKQLKFVIQQHAARAMHYDLRLEIENVLVSWAVPKGPSLSSAIKRLAIMTEDHPIEYGKFEGIIPKGSYGAGPVIVWDHGTYKNLRNISMETALKEGKIEVFLQGEKIKGAFALVRTDEKTVEKSKWLLIKMRDEYSHVRKNPVFSHPESVKTGKKITDWQKKIEELSKEKKRDDVVLKVGKHKVMITNPDKIIFPKIKLAKRDLVAYYQKIAPIMLPYLKGRPLTMYRFPDGIGKKMFYQKDVPDYFPDYVSLQPVEKKSGGVTDYALINNTAALVYLGNYVCVPHVWLSKEPKLNYPDRMIFDFDPSSDAKFSMVKWAAKKIKAHLELLGLSAFVMTTGSRGLHVVAPIKRYYLFDEVREFAQEIAHYIVSKYPTKLTLEMRKARRGTKIFIDTLRNAWGATAIAPYAFRAKKNAPIAVPLRWKEISGLTTSQKYNIKNIFRRIARVGDPWKDINKNACSLTQARKKQANL